MSSEGTEGYTGVDNLEVMAEAKKYLAYLNGEIAAIAGPPRDGLTLLDFGAGAGTHTVDIRDRGYDVIAVEIDEGLRQRLESQGFTAHQSPDSVASGSVDVAYTMNVLEHIDDDVAALRSVGDTLRPGGRLVVYVPAFQVLYSSMDEKVGHLRRYRKAALVEAVTKAGFTVDECRYVDSLGFAASLGFKAIGNKDGDIGGKSISLYDTYAFPVSRVIDKATGTFVGKNLMLFATWPGAAG